MKKISDNFLKLHKFIVIFEESEASEYWKVASLKVIAECADAILKKKRDPDLLAIFLKNGTADLELIGIRFEALKIINDYELQLLIEHVTLSIKLLRKYPFRAFLLEGEA